MADLHQFVRVDFHRFKAFRQFSLHLRDFNILVGPNNAGKSTVLAAFRILAAAMRKANHRNPTLIKGPEGTDVYGYAVDLNAISVAQENLIFNLDESEPATVKFSLSNKNKLILYFPESNSCFLIGDTQGNQALTTTKFKSNFNCPIGFVPILGPVEHNERLYEKDAAQRALFNYRAARNFRNIWHHFPEKFDEFRKTLNQTWPGMDVEPQEIDMSTGKPVLHMFCPEDRIAREIFWAGFGFQVWCQMLTHLIQSDDKSIFLIDEPDIYLHSDLQRQLLGLLRNLGPDIIVATHSTEIITEAEPDDIVIINKKDKYAKRIKRPSQLGEVFTDLGSNLNPILTQLAKTRRAVFVEGKDFQVLSKFARRLRFSKVAARSDFAVIPIEGFNPDRVRSLKKGMETTIGGKIKAALILDKDYRCDDERNQIKADCKKFCDYVTLHRRKEIENFLLVPAAIERSIKNRIKEKIKRTGDEVMYEECILEFLKKFAAEKKSYVMGQCLDERHRFQKNKSLGIDGATVNSETIDELEKIWKDFDGQLAVIPGKKALSAINRHLQEIIGISVTTTSIIAGLKNEEIPEEMSDIIKNLSKFSALKVK